MVLILVVLPMDEAFQEADARTVKIEAVSASPSFRLVQVVVRRSKSSAPKFRLNPLLYYLSTSLIH
jgi:hypothetical protein